MAIRGPREKGYFAFDNVLFLPDRNCPVYPPEAVPPTILGAKSSIAVTFKHGLTTKFLQITAATLTGVSVMAGP